MDFNSESFDRAFLTLNARRLEERSGVTKAALLATLGTLSVLILYLLYAEVQVMAYLADAGGFAAVFLIYGVMVPLAGVLWIWLFSRLLPLYSDRS